MCITHVIIIVVDIVIVTDISTSILTHRRVMIQYNVMISPSTKQIC